LFTRLGGRGARFIALFLILSFTTTSLLVPAADAKVELRSSARSGDGEVQRKLDPESSRSVVDRALEREAVRDKLQMLGYTVDEIQARLDRLSDEQIQEMAERIEQVKAGGHLGLGDLDVAVLILLVVLAPILAVVWLAFMLVGHDIHLHRNANHAH